jgi:hypothetical protein
MYGYSNNQARSSQRQTRQGEDSVGGIGSLLEEGLDEPTGSKILSSLIVESKGRTPMDLIQVIFYCINVII